MILNSDQLIDSKGSQVRVYKYHSNFSVKIYDTLMAFFVIFVQTDCFKTNLTEKKKKAPELCERTNTQTDRKQQLGRDVCVRIAGENGRKNAQHIRILLVTLNENRNIMTCTTRWQVSERSFTFETRCIAIAAAACVGWCLVESYM